MLKESKTMSEELVNLTERGEQRLIQVAQATALVSELIYSNSNYPSGKIPSESVAALLACFADQLESVVAESSRMREDIRHGGKRFL